MTRLVPRSLFGRLMLVLAGGLVIAQLASAVINLAERDSALVRASGMRPAQRFADIVKLLDSLAPGDRERIAAILSVPPLRVSLDRPAIAEDPEAGANPPAAIFATVLRTALGDDRALRVAVSAATPDRGPGRGRGSGGGPGWGRGPGGGPGLEPGHAAGPGDGPPGAPPHGSGMHRFGPDGPALFAQVQLRDGTWATFDSQLPPSSATLPWRALATLLLLLAAVLLVSWIAVRWITRPLDVLAAAADELGRNINRPPLPETGPVEVSRAAHAFNTMQARLARLIEDRTKLLAAMSHDLKTPITRMRLRAELLEDDATRARFDGDLREMESMVSETLAFMRGLGAREPAQPIDVTALLESLQSDYEAMDRTVTVAGRADAPYPGMPSQLRRCLANLLDNATIYGKRADIAIEDSPTRLTVRIRDRGPGIPEDKLEAVFDPFVRLESSRSRETGGTGLGLAIARDIARAHGGDVRLANLPEGGLEAVLTLARG